ncbi:MAG: glutamate-5-semialdehyde dehydrogenase [Pseudomonadota bacterium]
MQGAPKTADNNDSAQDIVRSIGLCAKSAAADLSQKTDEETNKALNQLADIILEQSDAILAANKIDVAAAEEKQITAAMIDRLTLNDERIQAIAQSVRDIAALDNPVGLVLETTERPNGLVIEKISVPIGVLGMIYESRPNVTIDAAALCLKSRNAVLLRGGSESFHSSQALFDCVQKALKANNFPIDAVTMMPSTDRALVGEMLKAHDYIDVIIPRGGKGLTGRVMSEATMPVFAHLDGNCHIYIHASADKDMALDIIKNAKLRRTGICGSAESLLFDQALPKEFIHDVLDMLCNENCEIVGDETIQSIHDKVQTATEEDWRTEYLDKKISAKMVATIDEAITHINTYGSHHTDAIISNDDTATQEFIKRVDSAIVMHNTSTQFADGGEFGMGAEIGIGTGKLHARGPVGIRQLTTFKYIVKGNGHTRP